jgi:hypothetical protein
MYYTPYPALLRSLQFYDKKQTDRVNSRTQLLLTHRAKQSELYNCTHSKWSRASVLDGFTLDSELLEPNNASESCSTLHTSNVLDLS